MFVFLFMCGLVCFSLDYENCIHDCAHFAKLIKNYIKYSCIEKIQDMLRRRRERYELSNTGLEQIKDALFKHQNDFTISDSVILIQNTDELHVDNACFYTELLPEYSNINEWSSKHIGDMLFIISLLKERITSREYLRVLRCYMILLDEFIYNLYDTGLDSDVYNKINEQHCKLLKCIMSDLAMTKREEQLSNQH